MEAVPLTIQERPKSAGRGPTWPAGLDRPFDALLFDWDGTAVAGRSDESPVLAHQIGRLLEHGVRLAVVTGTHVGHLERQLIRHLPRSGISRLYLCTNRGSEVYGFPDGQTMERLFVRKATDAENRALDQAALQLQRTLWKEFHVGSEVIMDRMNRRKVDLLPVPEWRDPQKSQMKALLAAVDARLGVQEGKPGLLWLIERARVIARESGLSDPRITSDLKHIEIGLTDKSDASKWFVEHVMRPNGISADRLVILGDEVGAAAGVQGSDALLAIPSLEEAPLVTVGVEPEDSQGIYAVPGGPAAFRDFLDLQLAYRDWGMSTDPVWCVEQGNFDPTREREMETLFAVGNGRMGVRGALEIGIPSSQSDAYFSGIYDAKAAVQPYSELEFLTPGRDQGPYIELVSFPFPFQLRLRVNGRRIVLSESSPHGVLRRLCLGTGILRLDQEFESEGRRVRVSSLRTAALTQTDLLLHEFEVSVSGGSARVEIEVGTDFDEFHLRHPHLLLIHPQGQPPWSIRGHPGISEMVLMETQASRFRVAMASRMQVDGRDVGGRGWSGELREHETLRVRRLVAAVDSRESSGMIETEAASKLQSFDFGNWHRVLAGHRRLWANFWETADLPFSRSPGLTESQRFNAYHLRIAAPVRPLASVPARTLTGRGYEGHVFWDAEIFILPFFALQEPRIARTMLQYRHHTLEGAIRRARDMGCRGACFAWESTVNGDDVTPKRILLRTTGEEIPIYTGQQQIHVTADIAYGVWHYWYCTQDSDFLVREGVEILFQTARFWLSRSVREGDQFHIEGVIGPDEYHHDVRDNAYTNWMARFNVRKALWAREWLARESPARLSELCARLSLGDSEFADWADYLDRLHVPVPGPDGVIEQFDGFFRLESIVLEPRDRLKAPVRRLLDWERVNRLQLCKQADVLMLPFLFPEEFSPEIISANYNYYEPITDHGSSLSPPVHAMVAALVGRRDTAISYYSQAVELDLFNLMDNTSLGVHAACMGGAWQALMFGLMGVRLEETGPVIRKRVAVPEEWGQLRARLRFRGKVHDLEVGTA